MSEGEARELAKARYCEMRLQSAPSQFTEACCRSKRSDTRMRSVTMWGSLWWMAWDNKVMTLTRGGDSCEGIRKRENWNDRLESLTQGSTVALMWKEEGGFIILCVR